MWKGIGSAAQVSPAFTISLQRGVFTQSLSDRIYSPRKGTDAAYYKSGQRDGNEDEPSANSGPGIGPGRVDVFAPVRFSQGASTSSSRTSSCASTGTPISCTFTNFASLSDTSVESLSPGFDVNECEDEGIALTTLARSRRSSSMSPPPLQTDEHHQRRHLLSREEEEDWAQKSRNYGGTQEQSVWRKTGV